MSCESIRAGITTMLDGNLRPVVTSKALQSWKWAENRKTLVELESYADGFVRVYVDEELAPRVCKMLEVWLLELTGEP